MRVRSPFPASPSRLVCAGLVLSASLAAIAPATASAALPQHEVMRRAQSPAPSTLTVSENAQSVALAAPAPADSAAAVRAAINAQRSFERIRLHYMPHGSLGSGSGCDERIGRFCYTYGDRSRPSPEPPPEREEVAEARRKLIDQLDSLVAPAAGDPWVVGILVHYQLEDADTAAALRSSINCSAQRWWCSALRGVVHHRSGRHLPAEDAFTAARSLMTPAERCDWDDISQLLPDSASRVYRALPCDRRIELSANAWWLAKPLMSIRGNQRRSEHDYRRVMVQLAARGVNPAWLSWGADMEELTIRFGWPQFYTRYWNLYGNPADQNYRISQYHPEPSYNLIPAFSAITEPLAAAENAWTILPEWSNEEYSPLPMTLSNLPRQTARFLRGDSLLLVTRAATTDDAPFEGVDSVDFAAAIASSHREQPVIMLFPGNATGHTFQFRVPNASSLLAIEVSNGQQHYARARSALLPIARSAAGHAISDILLLQRTELGNLSLEDASARMLTGSSVPRDGGLSIFWECYGVARGDEIEVSVAAEPLERGFLRRVGEALRILSGDGGSRVRWTEDGTLDGGILSRSIGLQTSSLRPGRYELALSVRINGAEPVTARRTIEIVR